MSSEWDDLEAEARAATEDRGQRCAVDVFLSSLLPYDADIVRGVLANPGISNTGLHRAFRKRAGDAAPSAWSIGRHRREDCRCTKGAR
ncbi:hypothetical protein [Streptomyces sp. NPDC048611]|uniref:hypothetical protein n=1 Tax=Streptomyces sp. NPDC048611 TaxID=3155635 RepID=UPI0034180CF5